MIGRTNINGTNDASGVGAVLSIDAPTGSTVTVSQGSFSKILRDFIEIDTQFSRYFYLIKPSKFGSWTITATNGQNTTDETVLVTTNENYEVKLTYKFFIIKDGVWQIDDNLVTKVSVNFSYPIGYVQEKTTGNVVGGMILPSMDITQYNNIVLAVADGSISWNAAQCPAIGISSSVPTINGSTGDVSPYNKYQLINSAQGPISAATYVLNISTNVGNKYIWVTCSGYGSNLGTVNITNLYLEKISTKRIIKIMDQGQVSSTSAYMTANFDNSVNFSKYSAVHVKLFKNSTLTCEQDVTLSTSSVQFTMSGGGYTYSMTLNVTNKTIACTYYSGDYANHYVDVYGIEK